MLTVLSHSGLGDIAAVVTRYYGGIKLGTGGLVKAYSGAVQEALLTVPRTERVDAIRVQFEVPYAVIGAVQQLLPTVAAELESQDFDTHATFIVRLPRAERARLISALGDLTRGQSSLVDLDA
jgi:putative IMPACT (imprinted ancient) family translation regulator